MEVAWNKHGVEKRGKLDTIRSMMDDKNRKW